MANGPEIDPPAGARNLLIACAGAAPGERLLIAYEPERYGYFDRHTREDIAAYARGMGLDVMLFDVGFSPSAPALPGALLDEIGKSDLVIFLSRLGDQLRFSEMPTGPRFVTCFTLNRHLLGSAFGRTDYRAFLQIKAAVDRALFTAEQIVLTCPVGTEVEGRLPQNAAPPSDTTSLRFPMSVFSPVPAAGFSGRVALGGFLTGTGSQYYDDYTVTFAGQVFALLDKGRLAGFDGSVADVARAQAQYDRVAARFGIDRNYVHSWHAGIHPGCGFPWDMRQSFETWGGAAFGNPRILHFHTCGAYAPGEISWNLFDPTIEVDGVRLWEDGRFHVERLTGGSDMLDRYPDAAAIFAAPDREIGHGDSR